MALEPKWELRAFFPIGSTVVSANLGALQAATGNALASNGRTLDGEKTVAQRLDKYFAQQREVGVKLRSATDKESGTLEVKWANPTTAAVSAAVSAANVSGNAVVQNLIKFELLNDIADSDNKTVVVPTDVKNLVKDLDVKVEVAVRSTAALDRTVTVEKAFVFKTEKFSSGDAARQTKMKADAMLCRARVNNTPSDWFLSVSVECKGVDAADAAQVASTFAKIARDIETGVKELTPLKNPSYKSFAQFVYDVSVAPPPAAASL